MNKIHVKEKTSCSEVNIEFPNDFCEIHVIIRILSYIKVKLHSVSEYNKFDFFGYFPWDRNRELWLLFTTIDVSDHCKQVGVVPMMTNFRFIRALLIRNIHKKVLHWLERSWESKCHLKFIEFDSIMFEDMNDFNKLPCEQLEVLKLNECSVRKGEDRSLLFINQLKRLRRFHFIKIKFFGGNRRIELSDRFFENQNLTCLEDLVIHNQKGEQLKGIHFSKLTNLRKFTLSNWSSLLNDDFLLHLRNLGSIDLSLQTINSENWKNLTKLKYLNLSSLSKMDSFPYRFLTSLKTFEYDASETIIDEKIELLPLNSLDTAILKNFRNKTIKLATFFDISSVTKLILKNFVSKCKWEKMEKRCLHNLRFLELRKMNFRVSVLFIIKKNQLQELVLEKYIEKDISEMIRDQEKSLTSLKIIWAVDKMNINFIFKSTRFENLRNCSLKYCTCEGDGWDISSTKNLESLELSNCKDFKDKLFHQHEFGELRNLILVDCDSISGRKLPWNKTLLNRIENGKINLEISGCPKIYPQMLGKEILLSSEKEKILPRVINFKHYENESRDTNYGRDTWSHRVVKEFCFNFEEMYLFYTCKVKESNFDSEDTGNNYEKTSETSTKPTKFRIYRLRNDNYELFHIECIVGNLNFSMSKKKVTRTKFCFEITQLTDNDGNKNVRIKKVVEMS